MLMLQDKGRGRGSVSSAMAGLGGQEPEHRIGRRAGVGCVPWSRKCGEGRGQGDCSWVSL